MDCEGVGSAIEVGIGRMRMRNARFEGGWGF